jgi:lipoprotein-anchoring transpeptidase ErfK/SrfK
MKRAALIATVSLAALICGGAADAKAPKHSGPWWAVRAAPASEAPSKPKRKHRSERPGEAKAARESERAPPQGPLQVIISIDKQRATLFANGAPYATTRISSGTPGHPTPMGVFSVIQKSRHHVSNLYDAPMPYMQRITWSGSALHEGPLPGRPASHGCVRLTAEFARLLWKATRIGTRVIITRDEVIPLPIEHPRLDALLADPTDAEREAEAMPTSAVVKVAEAGAMAFASARKRGPSRRGDAKPARAAEPAAAPVVILSPAHAPIMPIVSLPLAGGAEQQATKLSAVGGQPEPPVKLAVPRQPAAPDVVDKPAAAAPAETIKAAEVAKPVETAKPAEPVKAAEAVEPAEPAAPAEPVAPAASIEPAVPAPAPTAAAEPTPAAEPPATTAAAEVPLPQPLPPPAPMRQQTKRKPVSLFVSLKDHRLYARQGMTALFDMPISIAHAEEPLGTHVFTAMGAKDGGGLRWSVVSIPSHPSREAEAADARPRKKGRRAERAVDHLEAAPMPVPSAASALNRVVMPPAALERIAGLVLPGSSLIVSDNKLSDETSDATEFIVLTR